MSRQTAERCNKQPKKTCLPKTHAQVFVGKILVGGGGGGRASNQSFFSRLIRRRRDHFQAQTTTSGRKVKMSVCLTWSAAAKTTAAKENIYRDSLLNPSFNASTSISVVKCRQIDGPSRI